MRNVLSVCCAAALLVSPAWADRVEVGPYPEVTDFVFEFEQFATDTIYGPGDFVEATINFGPIGDVTLRIERPGSVFKFTDLSPWSESGGFAGGVPDDWGAASLDPFIDLTNPAEFRFTAIVPLGYAVLNTGVRIGDFTPSDDDQAYFDGEGVFLFNNPGGFHDTGGIFATAGIAGIPNAWDPASGSPPPEPVYSFTGRGGGPDEPMSLFWDNLVISVVAVDDLPTTSVAPPIAGSPNSEFGPGYLPNLPPPPTPIPEPGSLALLGAGLAAFVLWRRRR